jgi:cytochrome P450
VFVTSEQHDDGRDEITRAMAMPEFRHDPYPLYARMRRGHPVYRSPDGIWYLTRYADVEAALQNRRLSNDRERLAATLAGRQEDMRHLSRLMRRLGRVMTNTDPPAHTRLRKLANKALTARHVQNLRARIQAIVDELIDDAIAAGSTMDLVTALASPLPVAVILDLFGIPPSDREQVKDWLRQVTNLAQGVERVEMAIEQLYAYLVGQIQQRRAKPADDVVGALVAGQDGDDPLTDEELLATCFVMLTGGVETTANLIGNATLALLRHPDQMRRLQEEPTLIRTAVEELVRYDTPTQIIIRVVAETLAIGERTLVEGDLVYLVLAATNHDPDHFVDPDRLDLGRSNNHHLSFGIGGPHFCLGAPLARLQGEIAIGTLLRRLPTLRLDAGGMEWQLNPMLRGPARLLLAY